MALPFYCCQILLSKFYCIFSQILSIDQIQRKPCFCLVFAQLKLFAAVLRQAATQSFKTFHIYTVISLWHAKLLKISAFTPWGSAARLEGMKSLRIHNSFLWNAKNRLLILTKHRGRPSKEKGVREHSKWKLGEMNHTTSFQLQPRQKDMHPMILFYLIANHFIIILYCLNSCGLILVI